MSTRNYLSGSRKRKLRKERDEKKKKFTGSILKFTEPLLENADVTYEKEKNCVDYPSEILINCGENNELTDEKQTVDLLDKNYNNRTKNNFESQTLKESASQILENNSMTDEKETVNIYLPDKDHFDCGENSFASQTLEVSTSSENNNLLIDEIENGNVDLLCSDRINYVEENFAYQSLNKCENFENAVSKSGHTKEATKICYNDDPATWLKIDDNMIDYFISNPPNQNLHLLSETGRQIGKIKRRLTVNHFYRQKQNSEKVLRKWLVLSQSTKNIFCWVCKLLVKNCSSNQLISGYNDWKHAAVRLSEHENSIQHREAVLQMSRRKTSSQRIDASLVHQYEEESNYWKAVLKRVVSVIKFLCQRGLPFFGENETIGSKHNGNFLGCLEVIAQYDSFLASHLEKCGNPGSGKVSYLSSTCINEFITIMSHSVLKHIANEVLSSKYFSVIVDSTADITHIDQLCFVLRYVSEDQPVERFLKFIPIYSHRSESLAENVLETLQQLGINVSNCRGQSYDNAANMAGKYSGLQARIKEINPLAEFVPCSAHSLNLVGVNAVESCSAVVQFFFLVQHIYNFFSLSTHRWHILSEQIKADGGNLSLKSRCATRWCADASAVRSLRKNYGSILKVLHSLAESEEENSSTKSESSSLLKKMKKFENVLNIIVWDTLLQRLYQTSMELQKVSTNLSQIVPLYQSLIDFTQYIRDNFVLYEKLAEELSDKKASYETFRVKKTPRSKDLHAPNTPEVQLSPRDQYIAKCYYALCDSLISNLSTRSKIYKSLSDKFDCLINMKSLINLREKSSYLQNCYASDIEDSFSDEVQQFSSLVENSDTVIDMLNKVRNLEETFPNIETALRIFLTLPVSNCSGERSFSLLKRIKSSTRTTLLQEKLSSLALLCIEDDITQKLDFNDVINDFANMKVRKKHLF